MIRVVKLFQFVVRRSQVTVKIGEWRRKELHVLKADKSTEKCYAEQFSYHYSKFSGIELVLPYFALLLVQETRVNL